MKCLFTDILNAVPPETITLDSSLQIIPGTDQLLYKLEQGMVLVQQWQLAEYDILYFQSGITNHISFEIRHAEICNCYLFCLAGKLEFDTYHSPGIYLREGHGHFFTNVSIQGFCSFRLNRVSPSLLIIVAKATDKTLSVPFSLSPDIQEELSRILFTSYMSVKHFHETQISQLIKLSHLSASVNRPRIHFGDKDLEGIHLVKTIIDQTPEKYFTLLSLSQRAGMNSRKLNTGFKNLYKQTIFEYLHDKRMLNAHEEIIATDTALKIIGKVAGYRSYANFSSAFKAHFGYTPTELRKE